MPVASVALDGHISRAGNICPAIVVSPHYDDAVFSCGERLAADPGAIVVTVCAGLPANGRILTGWDEACGFHCAAEAMRCRRKENREALAALRARPHDLDFLDSQYLEHEEPGFDTRLQAELVSMLARWQPPALLIPLGLYHCDHVRTSDALLQSFMTGRFGSSLQWLAYEEIPYRTRRGAVQARLAQLHQRGVIATAQEVATRGPKAEAVGLYSSQLRGLGMAGPDVLLDQQERYWQLDMPQE